MVLVLAIHSVSTVTAKVPFSMIALIDHIRQRDLPPELKCRQVFPTSGGRSSSLWDVASIPLLLEWLDQHMDASTTNEVFEVCSLCQVQEAFAYGISAELTRLRTAEKVSANTRATAAAVQERTKSAAAVAQQQMSDLDAKFRVSEQATAAMRATGQAASRTAAALGTSMRFVSSKALENERVSAAASSLNKLFFSRAKTSLSEESSSAYSANPSANAAAHGTDGARSAGELSGSAPAAPAQPAAKPPITGTPPPAPAAALSAAPSSASEPASLTKIFTLGEEDEHPK